MPLSSLNETKKTGVILDRSIEESVERPLEIVKAFRCSTTTKREKEKQVTKTIQFNLIEPALLHDSKNS